MAVITLLGAAALLPAIALGPYLNPNYPQPGNLNPSYPQPGDVNPSYPQPGNGLPGGCILLCDEGSGWIISLG
ncbi:hypothetical protein VMT65_26295 [Nocardia sp. CDC153]|uniref:hypothetical protein n=1 Tax=Nocardia sp. CDC153 TaxID=3112167 RepID=UPI002DBD6AC9|nr:hypothetical protein [Nocardia sp. CDC153]MEC3956572.1 hypothetical protein [Nocardia sp. CDC153]